MRHNVHMLDLGQATIARNARIELLGRRDTCMSPEEETMAELIGGAILLAIVWGIVAVLVMVASE